jgi:hypothetical protein
VLRRVGPGAIDLEEREARGIVDLLNQVEAGDARLLQALAGVLEARLAKGLDVLGLDPSVDVNDQHAVLLGVCISVYHTRLPADQFWGSVHRRNEVSI